jgi:antitoxin (DNA-binding transcriptional repressor) of toxin-antitoxin stability system
MKTLSATKARANLGNLLSRAVKGEDIGIVDSSTGTIIALRPVRVYSEDYALMEYGMTGDEMDKVAANLSKKAKQFKKAGKLKPWP